MKKTKAAKRSVTSRRPSRKPSVKTIAKAAGKTAAKTNAKSTRKVASDVQEFERLVETKGANAGLKSYRFGGVSLGGGKTDKTVVAILEYYPDRKRVFLKSLRDQIGGGAELPDDQLLKVLNEDERGLHSIAFDAALILPICVRCDVKCVGISKCTQPEVKWMWQMHKKRDKTKRPNKMFTPYTERSTEIFIASELEEPFHPSHALGSNAAPLTARAQYLQKLINVPLLENYPKLTLWRIGLSLNIPKSYLRFHRHAVDSDEARLYILKTLIDKEIAFIYQQDLKVMVENSQAFDALMGALTGFLKFRGQTEKPPSSFPKNEAWIDFPKSQIQWF